MTLQPEEWAVLNRERGLLIDKQIAGTLTPTEETRLKELTIIADNHLDEFEKEGLRWI